MVIFPSAGVAMIGGGGGSVGPEVVVVVLPEFIFVVVLVECFAFEVLVPIREFPPADEALPVESVLFTVLVPVVVFLLSEVCEVVTLFLSEVTVFAFLSAQRTVWAMPLSVSIIETDRAPSITAS